MYIYIFFRQLGMAVGVPRGFFVGCSSGRHLPHFDDVEAYVFRLLEIRWNMYRGRQTDYSFYRGFGIWGEGKIVEINFFPGRISWMNSAPFLSL
jgi:hypothetical protein